MANDYARVVYNEKDRPKTTYPGKLIKYLIQKFQLNPNTKILELGPGRGEFLNEFHKNGLEVYAVDISDYVTELCPEANFKKANLETEKIPFADNFFDVVYTKSFVEHFYFPEKIFNEIFRVLKPGGKIITLTPHWKYMYKIFYEDHTHRTPFTIESLSILNELSGFKNIITKEFIQLPILWKYNFLKVFSIATRILLPTSFSKFSKWIRFSKEVMIISVANKP